VKVPLLDLKAQYKTIKSEIDEAIQRVCESQFFILGPEVKALEDEIGKYIDVKHCVGVSSGSDALLVALMAVGIKPGDEIIVPSYSFFATAGVVSRLNAVPVFVDIDPVSFNIDTDKIEKRITKRTKAIIPVHLFGQTAEMDEIEALAKKYDVRVIEDAAQTIGTQYKDGRNAGTIGDIGCFSFFPSKNLGCFGDGGMVVTDNDELAEKLRVLRVHGGKPKYHHKVIGGNFRLDAIQAAILRAKLKYLNAWSEKRRINAEIYTKLFIESGMAKEEGKTDFDSNNRILLPKPLFKNSGHKNYHIYNQYVIRVKGRDDLRNFLKEREIGNEVYYPVPFHRQDCFKDLGFTDEGFPISNIVSEDSLAVPIYSELKEDQIKYVVDTIYEFVKSS